MFQTLFGSLLNHLYHYASENVSVKHLSLICITSTLTTIYLLKFVQFMEDLAVFIAVNHSGSFRVYFVKFKKIYVIYRLRVGPYGEKLWPRAAFSRPRSQFFTIRTSQPANNIYL